MSRPRSIIQLGNPILRDRATEVRYPTGDRIQSLIDDLIVTVRDSNGVGIAAPQTAASDRLFIVASRPNLRYPHAPQMEPTAMINPRILDHSAEIDYGWEGCLSVPDLRGWVPRYRAIAVEYCDRHGHLCRQDLTDFVARIFQHELDHLNGLVFLDRVESPEQVITEAEYQTRIVKES